ncbi:MAG: hypothetical protein HY040_20870 [Planctomycetes bacterium]|nr:hypothetical protein [Planctomycetota bacterium]
MNEHDLANLDHDPRFPSGAWTGFFLQYWLPGRHHTDLSLTCRAGELAGTGQDWVGAYTIDGSYDRGTGDCAWTKQYLGKHAVAYRGVNDGSGIWGVWEIQQFRGLYVDRGGFHIWPEGTDVSGESDQTEQAVLALMREEFGSWSARVLRKLLVLGAAVGLGLLVWWWGQGY